jgi:hypothetical protein
VGRLPIVRLRYGFAELLLVQPLMASYRRPPAGPVGGWPPGDDESPGFREIGERSWMARDPAELEANLRRSWRRAYAASLRASQD